MGMPRMPKPPRPPSEAPNLLDPTVMFARAREKQKSLMSAGRQSTILASGTSPKAPGSALLQTTSPAFAPLVSPRGA